MTTTDLQNRLFLAIACSDQPGMPSQVQGIETAVQAGADLEACSERGETPLTHAIFGGMGSPKAVKKLLELGADPSKRDHNGWTPWAACVSQLENPVVADRMKKIRALLVDYGADRSDERLLQFQKVVEQKNLAEAETLIQSGVDPTAPMIAPMMVAINNQDLAMVQLLLRHNVNPNGRPQDPMPYLLKAAETGNLALVQQLVQAGADVTRYGWGDERYTAEFCAQHQGHQAVAEWLRSMTPAEKLAERQRQIEARNPKFKALYDQHTNGINYDLTTEDIVQKLEQWDVQYGIEISHVEDDGLLVRFATLPDNLVAFSQEIYAFCPDTIDQHFGCMDDLVDSLGKDALPPELEALLAGVNVEQENFGEILLQRSLQQDKTLTLWWD